MMYRHTVTVYDRNGELVKTIPDTVNLADFGIPGYPTPVQGAPVEAAFAPDGKHAYVSNYSMYGEGFGPEGDDDCPQQNSYDNSFVYRINTENLAIDGVIPVGKVPKYVAVTPDGKYVLTTNWCSYDLSVADTTTNQEVKRIPIGPYPRGIVVSPDSKTAYVAVMGTQDIARVDLTTFAVSYIRGVGGGPRHLVISPDGASLFVTLNAEGKVAKVDPVNGVVQYKVSTGQAAAEHGDLHRRPVAVRRELRVEHDEQARHERPPRGPDRADRLPPDRHHLRPHHRRGLGRELRRHDPDLLLDLTEPGRSTILASFRCRTGTSVTPKRDRFATCPGRSGR